MMNEEEISRLFRNWDCGKTRKVLVDLDNYGVDVDNEEHLKNLSEEDLKTACGLKPFEAKLLFKRFQKG